MCETELLEEIYLCKQLRSVQPSPWDRRGTHSREGRDVGGHRVPSAIILGGWFDYTNGCKVRGYSHYLPSPPEACAQALAVGIGVRLQGTSGAMIVCGSGIQKHMRSHTTPCTCRRTSNGARTDVRQTPCKGMRKSDKHGAVSSEVCLPISRIGSRLKS